MSQGITREPTQLDGLVDDAPPAVSEPPPVRRSNDASIDKRLLTVVAVLLLIGTSSTLATLDVPVLRDRLVDANILEAFDAEGARPWDICSNPAEAYNRPCGLQTIEWVLTTVVNPNVAIRLASYLGALALIGATIAFFNTFNPAWGLGRRWVPFELLVVFLNPISIYKFWDGNTDALFSALALAALTLARRAPRSARGPALEAILAIVVLTALYVQPRAILLMTLLVALLAWDRTAWRQSNSGGLHTVRRTALLGVVLAATISGIFGINPLLNWNASEPAFGIISYPLQAGVFLATLVVAFGPLLLLAPRVDLDRDNLILFLLAGIYAHVAMVSLGANGNMGYYVTIFPFVAGFLCRALDRLARRRTRRAFQAAFLTYGAVLLLAFSTPLVRPIHGAVPLPFAEQVDVVRLGAHLQVGDQLAFLNETVPTGARVVVVDSTYNAPAFAYVYQRSGIVRSDLVIDFSYGAPSLQRIEPGDFVLYQYGEEEPLGYRDDDRLRSHGHGLFERVA